MQEKYDEQMVVLMGNHELYVLEDFEEGKLQIEECLIDWIKLFPYYYETDKQIFVHSGIDEEAGEYWKIGSEESYFCNKYPHTTGEFYKDIISGHISAYDIARAENELIEKGDIYYDRKNHYYIDGETEKTKKLPVLMYDTVSNKYFKIIDGKKISVK